jgi:hypothetical protein
MSYSVRCTNPSWEQFGDVGWAHPYNPPLQIYGETLLFGVHSRRRYEFDSREQADQAVEWLTKQNKRYGFRFEVENAVQIEGATSLSIHSSSDCCKGIRQGNAKGLEIA